MRANRNLTIQRIEFSSIQEFATIYGIIEERGKSETKTLSRIRIHQKDLNRYINRLQAEHPEEEVLSYLIADEVEEGTVEYVLQLQNTCFAQTPIELSEIAEPFLLIRA